MTTSPFLAVPGAVAAEGADIGVAAHYGNPLVEQRRLARREAIIDLSHRGVIAVTGEDRLRWLHSLTSQSLEHLAPGESAETLLLDASGRIEHEAHLLDDGIACWLIVENSQTESLLRWLDRMRFTLRVEVSDQTARFAVIGSMSSHVEPARENGVPLVWLDPWPAVTPGGFGYAAPPETQDPWSWQEALVPRSSLGDLAARVTAGSLPVAGTLSLEALRIAAHRPRLSTEVDARTLPHELDLLRTAVHLSKGCYRGQETVAKVHNLGRPPRRLVMLHLDGSETVLPEHGARVSADKPMSAAEPVTAEPGDGDNAEAASGVIRKDVGVVTSAAVHYELGPIALALVKRAVPEDLVLTVSTPVADVAASQEPIVPASAGAHVDVSHLARLRSPRG